jgi:hypothetical protein
MAKFYEGLTDDLRDFIVAQQIYFVASATAESRINLSPKGADTLRVLDAHTVAYLDLTGSGNETAAHMLHDGRLTMMLCSFGEKPLILRLYGRGRVVLPGALEWNTLAAHFPHFVGIRQLVVLAIESVQTSCGFGVPQAEAMQPRTRMIEWAEGKGEEALAAYRQRHNARSIDGLSNPTVTAGSRE